MKAPKSVRVVVLGSLLSLIVAVAAPGSASAKACGSVKVKTAQGTTLGGPVRATRATCKRARQVIRYALKHPSGNSYLGPKGWECGRGTATSGASFECRRGLARVWVPNRAT